MRARADGYIYFDDGQDSQKRFQLHTFDASRHEVRMLLLLALLYNLRSPERHYVRRFRRHMAPMLRRRHYHTGVERDDDDGRRPGAAAHAHFSGMPSVVLSIIGIAEYGLSLRLLSLDYWPYEEHTARFLFFTMRRRRHLSPISGQQQSKFTKRAIILLPRRARSTVRPLIFAWRFRSG